ncbi:MAG TPA: hypothetical protein VMW10_08155 [Alphaproteobacteria bacterium]|nr:hypothetical protein [Alphaproteobacteria bacterium]
MHETSSLKSLAFKALERLEGNNARNKRETKGLLHVSHPINRETLHETKNWSWVKPLSFHPYSVLEDYEERLAIAEHDGHQTLLQAERIAYQDAFISVLVTLPQEAYENSHRGDWLDDRIRTAKDWLQAQNLFQPK